VVGVRARREGRAADDIIQEWERKEGGTTGSEEIESCVWRREGVGGVGPCQGIG
jgi:hypothetical protein